MSELKTIREVFEITETVDGVSVSVQVDILEKLFQICTCTCNGQPSFNFGGAMSKQVVMRHRAVLKAIESALDQVEARI